MCDCDPLSVSDLDDIGMIAVFRYASCEKIARAMDGGNGQGEGAEPAPTGSSKGGMKDPVGEPTVREHLGWIIHESGPADAEHAILMIPGGLCPWRFYDDVVAEPQLRSAALRFVATTIPGHAGTPPPDDLSQEAYARSAGRLAKDCGCDIVIGHSMGANVAVEMAALGTFSGPMVLLSPSFSREDEARFLWVLDRIGRVPGLSILAWKAMTWIIPSAMKGFIPPGHREAWTAELKKNNWRFFRAGIRRYFEYLNDQTSLVDRLCESGVKAWVVFGGSKDVGLKDEERRGLDACPTVTLIDWPEAGHNTLGKTAAVADLIVKVVR
jgi:pimeloyl-ACP methyl ester carboxylesterase